jgi:hypothetical protein
VPLALKHADAGIIWSRTVNEAMRPPATWSKAIDGALELYRSLWSEQDCDHNLSMWADSGERPTFVPYDSTDILVGIDAVYGHLQKRNRETGLIHLEWSKIAGWSSGSANCLIARQRLITVNRSDGQKEARTLNVIVATIGAEKSMRLLSVSEAPPAALLEMSRSYQRHGISRDEL